MAFCSPLSAMANESEFVIKAEEVTASIGETVAVKFMFQNNPGISLFTLGINYDKTKLALKEINGNSLMGGNFISNVEEDFLLWMSSSEDSTFNGTAFTAVFEVLNSAPIGKTEVSVSLPNEDGNILNFNYDDVHFEILAGHIDIIKTLLCGDADDDGVIDLKDITLVAKYFAGWDVEVNELAIDCDKNGKRNLYDLVRLAQFVAGWENVQLN